MPFSRGKNKVARSRVGSNWTANHSGATIRESSLVESRTHMQFRSAAGSDPSRQENPASSTGIRGGFNSPLIPHPCLSFFRPTNTKCKFIHSCCEQNHSSSSRSAPVLPGTLLADSLWEPQPDLQSFDGCGHHRPERWDMTPLRYHTRL